jgi:acetoin:2,6-dichlorophenolindophenol oxidoreductase subunit alpha
VADYVFAPDGPIAIIGEPDAEAPRYVNALDRRTGKPFNATTKATTTQAEEVVGRR